MKTKNRYLVKLYVAFMIMQILLYFLNSDQYFQLSGMYIFLFAASLFGMLWLVLNIWNRPVNIYQAIIVLLFITVLLSIIANSSAIERGYLLSYILLMFTALVFASMDFTKKELDRLSIAYICFGVIVSLLIIVVHRRFYADESNRITIQIGSNPLIDPNYLGACLVAPSFLALYKAFEGSKKHRRISWIATFIITIGLFLTGSRGALLAWGVGILVIFCKKFFHRLNTKKVALFIAVCIMGVVVALCIIPEAYIERMFDVGTWMDPSNMRRLSLWKNAIDHISQRPLLGYGLSSTVVTVGEAAHSTYLDIFVQIGVIGGLLFTLLLGALFLKKGNIFMKAIIASTAVWSVFIAAEATMYLWLNISLCIAYSNLKKGDFDEQNC